ncbi:MAG TPA: tRNA pseudouridine(38-40) synthase TruA [Phycisphaerae bacterium]|nr:tRNA pseudouridine(38-40) synthase TruA [Phycisphaerae bacterium]
MTDPVESGSVPRRNIRLVVSYDGRRFHGWQRQPEPILTVQGCLEQAICRVVGHPVTVNGTGRTDAGVHALGQGANFRTTNLAIPLDSLRRAADSKCPGDIAILSAREAPDDFHASISALGKTYRYRIHVAPAKPAMLAGRVYHCPVPLDVDLMADAAARLVGRHDFRGFASSAEQRQDTRRTIRRCTASAHGDEVHVTVSGDGFLYKMVRNITGTLIEIGRGRWGPERIDLLLASRDRRDGGPTALPGGLYLVSVLYPDGETGVAGGD